MSLFSSEALQGKRVLVTGATSGIGRATAILLSQCGAAVVLSGRDGERLAQTEALLSGTGHHAAATSLDNLEQVSDWVKNLALQMGPFDGVFHAAGIASLRPARMLKQSNVDEVFGSSIMAALGMAKAASQKGVLNDQASVVFMSSVAGSRGQAGMTAYSAAKAAIDGLVRSLSCELAPRAIRVNALAAGAVKSEMHQSITAQLGDAGISAYEQHHLLGFGHPQDVAQSALFLLSAASRWITGTTLVIDGGYMVK
ncbi:MAG: SDR family oxidoreductase [Rubrivivax sp.]|nr:MAG: SDR family oxidoreductase [Rubrivivax sp.]